MLALSDRSYWYGTYESTIMANVSVHCELLLCGTVLKVRSEAELEGLLLEVLILPSCDPRRSADVPSTSIYFGVNEALKAAVENGAETPAQSSVSQLQESARKMAVHENVDVASADSLRNIQKGAATETEIREKSRLNQEIQLNASPLKCSRKRRAEAADAPRATALRERSRTSIGGMEHRSKRPITKVHIPRKRKRKVYDELSGYKDGFPFMNYQTSDKLEFSHHLSDLSYFVVLDKDPDDPMMLVSLCEIDDLTTAQQHGFIRDLNSAFIGKQPRFTSVRSPYRDRTSSRLGQLSFQTYCDGHFIECGLVSHVHMLCLHQWALKEPLEKVVLNTWRDNSSTSVSLLYPSVGGFVADACSWLSSQLCYLMTEMGIECTDPPDIFIGSSLQSDCITNGLYRMFCRYVDYLCVKSDAHFQGVDYCNESNVRPGETEAYADNVTCDDRRAKRLKLTSYIARKKDQSRWQRNVEYDRDDMFFELDESELFEDVEDEMARFNGDHSDRHRRDTRRKRKLPQGYDDYGHERYQKTRRVHQDGTKYLTTDRERDDDIHWKRSDKRRAGRRDADADMSARDNLTSPSKYEEEEDSPDFMLYDEDGNIVVNCADTGRAVIDEVESGESARHEDQLKSAVDAESTGLSIVDEWYEPSSQLYGVIHDHCYISSFQCSLETMAPVVLENRLLAADVKSSDGDNSALPVIEIELVDAEEIADAKNNNLVDGRMSQLSSDTLDDAIESTAKKLHPLSSLTVPGGSAVFEVNSMNTVSEISAKNAAMKMHPLSAISAATLRETNAESITKSPKQPVSRKPITPQQIVQEESLVDAQKRHYVDAGLTETPVRYAKLVSPQQTARKEGLLDGQKRRHVGEDQVREKNVRHKNLMSPQQAALKKRLMEEKKRRAIGDNVFNEPVRPGKPTIPQQASRKASLVDGKRRRDVGKDVIEKPVRRNRPAALQQTSQKEGLVDVQRRDVAASAHRRQPEQAEYLADARKNRDSKTSSRTSDAAKVSRKNHLASEEIGRSNEKAPSAISSESYEVSTDTGKAGWKKFGVLLDNMEEVPSQMTEVPAKVVETEQPKVFEAQAMSVDRVADAEVSVEPDKTASESQPCPAALAAAARAASHYQDAYMSEMTDAYGVWPSSNFDMAFDPTDVPTGHMYNPFRKTWPYLQHVIDGKTDLLMKVCSFPDMKSFSIRRVMRENGFLWAVCLALFDPTANTPDSNLFSEADAAGKGKGAKLNNNALMGAFRQAVEAKKKVAAAKTKSAMVRQNSDDAAWSAKRPAGKVSIVFGSAVKSGGSLSSVVSAEQPAKTESTTEKLSSLLTSAASKINSSILLLISRKCGEQCSNKGAPAAECSLPATSKHLKMLSDSVVDMYDIAECKLEEIFAAEEADRMENEKVVESAAVVSTAASDVTCTTVVNAAYQPQASVSSSASSITSSSALLSSVSASNASTTEMTPVSGPSDARVSSATADVSPASVSEPVSVTATSTSAVTDKVMPVITAVSVTATVTATTVADMPPPPLPPLSCIGVGFELRASAVGVSSASVVSTSRSPVSASLATVDQKPLTCTSSVLASEQLMHMPPPPPANLYSVPPEVAVPLNVSYSSVPSSAVPSCPPPPTPVSFSSVPSSAVPSCPPPPTPWYLSSSTSSSTLLASATSAVNATSVSLPSPVSAGAQLSQASDPVPSTAVLVPPFQPRLAFAHAIEPGTTQQSLVSPAAFKSFLSSLHRGNRPFGPLKPVLPETQQSTAARLAGPVVRQVRPVSSTASLQSIPTAAGSAVTSPSNHAPVTPATTGIGSPLVGQVPPVPGVRPGPAQPVSASPGNPPRPIQPSQPTATSSVRGPWTGFRPRTTGPVTSVSQPVAPGTPTGPSVGATSRLPSSPAGPAGTVIASPSRPLTTGAAGVKAVQSATGPWLTSKSRVYVLNSDSSPLCKNVEVSLVLFLATLYALCHGLSLLVNTLLLINLFAIR